MGGLGGVEESVFACACVCVCVEFAQVVKKSDTKMCVWVGVGAGS